MKEEEEEKEERQKKKTAEKTLRVYYSEIKLEFLANRIRKSISKGKHLIGSGPSCFVYPDLFS